MSKVLNSDEVIFRVLDTYRESLENNSSMNESISTGECESLLQESLNLLVKIPNNSYLQNTIGLHLYKLNRLPEAIEYMRKAIELDPHIAQYKYHLGLFYFTLGDVNQALDTLRNLDLFWMNGGNPREELSDFLKAQEVFQEEAIRVTLEEEPKNILFLQELAEFYTENERYSKAIDCHKKILELEPENFDSLCTIANYSIVLNQIKRARLYFHKALKVQPDNYTILLVLIQLYINYDDYQNSLSVLNKAINQFPDDPEFLFYLALVHAKLEHRSKAVAYLERCLAIAPEYYIRVDQERLFRSLLKLLEV